MPEMNRFERFFIDGQWVHPVDPRSLKVINPATENAVADISLGSAADVDRAVQAARRAFPLHSHTPVPRRIEFFEKLLAVFHCRREEVAKISSLEMAAPITFATDVQPASCVTHIEAIIEILKQYRFDRIFGTTLVTQEPIGVVGLITPWNWPISHIVCKVLPALATGCTIILKPSEIAPLDAIIFAEMLEEAGLPPGVFNLVNGDGPTVGEAIARHPDVDMISFTGSTRAGVLVARAAAGTVKRVTRDLGGQSANIILDDADLVSAVSAGVANCFANCGQSCDAPTRMLISHHQYEAAVSIAASEAAKHTVGSPEKRETVLGPVANAVQFDKIQQLIASGIDQGARLVAGGLGRPHGFDRGYYVKPTVFADVSPTMDISQEEIIGPVLVLIPYRDIDEAIEIANGSEYGLAAYVQSSCSNRARKLARRLRAGSVFLNNPVWDVTAPFGGYKKSGNGREGGPHALAEYMEIKVIVGHG